MALGASEPVYTRRFWAKSEPRDGYPKRIHLLEHHLADVGACFEAMLAQPAIRRRLARSGGLDWLDGTVAARLALFAALHDIGKVSVGFQTQVWRDADFPGGRRLTSITRGHYRELAPVMLGQNSDTTEGFFGSLDWWWDATDSWDDCGGETVCALFIAALSHHGRPLQLEGDLNHNSRLWTGIGGLDPFTQLRRIGTLARDWFPKAWEPDGQLLPSNPAFQHHFLGLCTLADWIGSNEAWFEFRDRPDDNYMEEARRIARKAVRDIGLDIAEQRHIFERTPMPGFAGLFPHIKGPPNAIQQTAADTPPDEPLVIIESETGSGKTEAALWRFAKMYETGLVDGLYFALPTRVAAVQLHLRVKGFTVNLFPGNDSPPVVLAVPGYKPDADADAVALRDYNSHAAGHHEGDNRPWAAESSKRYLAAQIAVGTVDQAMMAALKVRHSHLRAACLSRNLLVVDEVHASDPYMTRVLKALLDAHLGAGGYALLMSATLGSVARKQWLSTGRRFNPDDAPPLDDAIATNYPAVSVRSADGESVAAAGENRQEKSVGITAEPLINNFTQVAELALSAARAGAKTLVVRNTVSNAIATQQALELAPGSDRGLLFSLNGIVTLHHSRYAPDDRRLLDVEVERRLGRSREPGGLVVVGTQTLEQSLDIDADLLITDLCPVDVLLQRIGRLHRHQRDDRPADYAKPACIVLTPDSDDLSPLLQGGSSRTGLGPHGYVYKDLRVLEATRRLVAEHQRCDIPRMNRLLVESATHPVALEAIEKLGEAWKKHALDIQGEILSDIQNARGNVVQRSASFFSDNNNGSGLLFPSGAEEYIRTRLGDEGAEVEFNPPPASPLTAAPIERLTISEHLLRGAVPDGPVATTETEGGFTFAVGDRRFRYDHLGLRREG